MSGIEHLIINNPFEAPKFYWQYDRVKRKFNMKEGRRPAGYLMASQQSRSFDDPGEFRELPLVNKIRERVDSWRKNDYPGVTGITKRLISHWNDPSVRENRLFFCQIEAAETLIWLTEGREGDRQGITIPSDGGKFQRICSKMATGSGKTIVMAMMIAWQVLNKITYEKDVRYSKTILVIAPGLTVKNRLQVLNPYNSENIYVQFGLVPDSLYEGLRKARVIIHNWHTLSPLEDNKKSVVKRGRESDEAFTRRIVGKLGTGKIMTINDEAHHAWRLKLGQNLKALKEEYEQATKWVEGLDKIDRTRGILKCYDFSATPFIPSGKSVNEEMLYEWIVSDFSLNDAIESGLVKTPRIAIRDDSGRFDRNYKSRFYHLYKDRDVKSDLGRRAKPEEPLPDLVKNAYYLLGQDWIVTSRRWKDDKSKVPPVMITVCNRTETAARIYHSFMNDNLDLPELSDPEKILHIDSRVLSVAEEREDDASDATTPFTSGVTLVERAEELRGKVDTVGKLGKAGEQVQNIIAVSMLSEGWDARNVTQIMGLRAFESQLLCEQVVGRGLRKTSYEINPKTGMFDPEYVNIFGVPFTFLPHEGSLDTPPPPTSAQTLIYPDPEKSRFQISWPNIDRIERTFTTRLKIDWSKLKPLELRPSDISLTVDMAQIIEGKPAIDRMTEIDLQRLGKKIRMQYLIFRTAKDLFENIKTDWKGNQEILLMQLVKIVEKFIETDKIHVVNVLEDELLRKRMTIAFNMKRVVQHILQAIVHNNTERRTLIFNTEKNLKSTTDMKPWYTKKANDYTTKSHISHAVHDSTWEASATYELEKNNDVEAWVKNDHIGFEIQYIFNGGIRKYYPDYIIKLANGIMLILEVKGQDSLENQIKTEALEDWVKAVNENSRFGTWTRDVAFDPSEIRPIIHEHSIS